ncbi:OprD family outer membrane protein [Pseudomonas cannabina]|uniref:OprD family outer membrane protein n=1 Tax=Pseudomonas cannabina TaxID=86840 RepID=A0A0P9QZE0_PSECA|nr:OprD family outer membrane protein [Pseudomonas cannabina]
MRTTLRHFNIAASYNDSIITKKVSSMRSNPSCKIVCGLSAAVAVALSATTSYADGFVDDAKVNLNLRNFYINRNFVDPANAQNYAEEWTQNFILDARSGFTQGTVGFGVDALGL